MGKARIWLPAALALSLGGLLYWKEFVVVPYVMTAAAIVVFCHLLIRSAGVGKMFQVLKYSWLSANVGLLLTGLWMASRAYRPIEIGSFFLGFFFMLSFPSSLVVTRVLNWAADSQIIGWLSSLRSEGSDSVSLVVLWTVFLLAGYLQWFVLVPATLRPKRNHGSPARGSNSK
jgi:hypothetical protein